MAAELLALVQSAIANDEQVNIGEAGSEPKGQLERFLKLSAIELSRLRSLILAFPGQIDVDTADSRFLPALAALVGIEDFNFDLPISQQREEIKRAVEVYKRKGTLFGIRRQIEVITRLNAIMDEMADNVLVANFPDRLSATFIDPDRLLTPGRPGDPASYSVDMSDERVVAFDVVIAYLQGEALKGLTRGSLTKLSRVMKTFVPADTTVRLVLQDAVFTDVFDRARLLESGLDTEGGDLYSESLAGQRTLMSNAPGGLSNDPEDTSLYVGAKDEETVDAIEP